MKKVLEYSFVILVVLALGITFLVDRMDMYNLGSRNEPNVESPTSSDSCSQVDTNSNNIQILQKIESIDSIVDVQNGTNISLGNKTKRYKDSVNLLKTNIKKDREIFEQEKLYYKKQQQEYQQEVDFLQKEKENLNIKYKKEHELNQVYSNSISQMRDSLIYSDSLINSKKKPKQTY